LSRRQLLLGAGGLALGRVARAETFAPIELSELRWTGKSPTFPLFRGMALGDFRGEVEVRIATRSEPVRYRKHLAFYRLSEALGSKLVPRTALFALRLPRVLDALRGDPEGLSLLRDDLAVLNDGTVTVMVSEPVAGAREIDGVGAETKAWRAWAEGRGSVPGERVGQVGCYVEALVLDYLASDTRRNAAVVDERGDLRLTENGGAFGEHPDPQGLDAILTELKRVTRFPRAFVQRLRAFDQARAERALHAGPFLSWLVASRPIAEMLERRESVVSLVSARVAELGEAEALAFP
jgi:hypothetical protein